MEINLTPEEIQHIARLISETRYNGTLEEIEQIVLLSRSILTKFAENVQRTNVQ